jgi:ribosomal protein L24E
MFVESEHKNIPEPRRGDMFVESKHTNILEPRRGDMFVKKKTKIFLSHVVATCV